MTALGRGIHFLLSSLPSLKNNNGQEGREKITCVGVYKAKLAIILPWLWKENQI